MIEKLKDHFWNLSHAYTTVIFLGAQAILGNINAQIYLKNSDLHLEQWSQLYVPWLIADTATLHGKWTIINSGDWMVTTNDSVIFTDSTTVVFTGGSNIIGGNNSTQFHKLEIDSSNISLWQNIAITQALTMQQGQLKINDKLVLLSPGAVVNENSDGYVFDPAQLWGTIVSSVNGNNLNNHNIGGLWLKLTCSGVGNVSLIRSHLPRINQWAMVAYTLYIDQLPTNPVTISIDQLFPHVVWWLTNLSVYQSNDGGSTFFKLDGGVTSVSPSLVNTETIFTVGDGITSIDDIGNYTLWVYPNPTAWFITIDFPSVLAKSMDVSLLDVSGKLVYSQSLSLGQQSFGLDLHHLSSGTYFVRCDDYIIKKLVIAE